VLLLDTTGELAAVYGLATVAFVGGTLVPRGGHNILEPAALGIPAVIGPSMENFREIADRFLRDSVSLPLPAPASARATAVVQIEHAASLAPALRYLFANPAQARQIGERARLIVESDQSGYAALCDEILAALSRRPATK
jgi:3-deoxy-D-manno-octulosonic-acid transferase